VYVGERRIERANSVEFNCELFTDRYIEFCFTYTTQAKTGAVADIREDCVPTGLIDGNLSRSRLGENAAKHILMCVD
jgi:hypothetical protein